MFFFSGFVFELKKTMFPQKKNFSFLFTGKASLKFFLYAVLPLVPCVVIICYILQQAKTRNLCYKLNENFTQELSFFNYYLYINVFVFVMCVLQVGTLVGNLVLIQF